MTAQIAGLPRGSFQMFPDVVYARADVIDGKIIQEQISNASTVQVTKIKLLAKKYILKEGLRIDRPIQLIGASEGKTTIKLNEDSSLHHSVILIGKESSITRAAELNEKRLWNSTSLSNVTIQDIYVEGNKLSTMTLDGRYHHQDEESLRRIELEGKGYESHQEATEWDYRFDDIGHIGKEIRFFRGIKANGITIWNADNVKIERCRVSQARSAGIVAQSGCRNITIDNCLIEENFIDGIAPDSIRSINIHSCILKNNTKAGFSWSLGVGIEKFPNLVQHVTISDCIFERNEIGFWANNIHNMIMSCCSFINNTESQISIDKDIESKGSHNTNIHTCTFKASIPSTKNFDWPRVEEPYFRELNNFIVGYSIEGGEPLNDCRDVGYEIRNDPHYVCDDLYANHM